MKHVNGARFSPDESQIVFYGSSTLPKKKPKKKKGGKEPKRVREFEVSFHSWDWKNKGATIKKITAQKWFNRPILEPIKDTGKALGSFGNANFLYDFNSKKATPLDLQVEGKALLSVDVHYAEELNAFAFLNYSKESITLVDAETHEVKFHKEGLEFPGSGWMFTGCKTTKGDYSFFVSGELGFLSTYHYEGGGSPKITYESTWINNDYDASFIGIAESKSGETKLVQTYKGGMVSSYAVSTPK